MFITRTSYCWTSINGNKSKKIILANNAITPSNF